MSLRIFTADVAIAIEDGWGFFFQLEGNAR